MNLDADSRTRIYADITLTYDPTGSTVEIKIDSTWYPASWQASAVYAGGKWAQTALTDGYFSGPQAPAAGPDTSSVVLIPGRHHTQVRVTTGDQIIAADSAPIDVR